MPQEILNWILGIATTIVTGLVTTGFFLLRSWISKKMGNNEESKKLNACLTIVENAVKEVFQIYVEALKKDGKFTDACHEKAKKMATDMILNRLTPALKDFLTTAFGDISIWISNQIETTIYTLKQN